MDVLLRPIALFLRSVVLFLRSVVLFFDIPQNGEISSHRELVTRSSSYVGMTDQSAEMQALIDEISNLRIQLLSAQQEVINMSSTI